jgi:hypothetical protein
MKNKYIEINGQLRGPDGRFYYNGGVKSEKRDKACPYCGAMIMRKSKTCRKCWQLGDKSIHWKGIEIICPICKKAKHNKSKGMCLNCFRGTNHPMFKGDNVGYYALHCWVKYYLGKPKHCSNNRNHLSKRYVWANISGEYRRDLSDWHSLCNSCNLTDGVKISNSRYYGKQI